MAPRPRWPLYAIAASVAALLFLLPSLVRRMEPPAPLPPVAGRPPVPRPPVAVATGYGRADWDQWVAEAKKTRALAVPAVVEALRPRNVVFRGSGGEDDLALRPSHVVVAERRPRFVWKKREGATYNVILDVDGRVVESGPLTAPEWRPPFDLQRGAEYHWQLEVTANGQQSLYPKSPEPPARFRVLEQSAVDAIDDARQRHPDDALLHAVVLGRYGLRAEALAAVDRLDARDAELAAALRASIRAWPQ